MTIRTKTETGENVRQKIGADPGKVVEDALHIENGFFTTMDGGYRLYYKSYRGRELKDVKYALVIFHGYGDHQDYLIRQTALAYAHLDDAWVFTVDYPGHGRSDGFWAYVASWDRFVGQIIEFIDGIPKTRLETSFSQKTIDDKRRLFALGIGHGCSVLTHVLQRRQDIFDAAVLSNPLFRVNQPNDVLNKRIPYAHKLLPWFRPLPPKHYPPKVNKTYKDDKMWKSLLHGPSRNHLLYNGKLRVATARELRQACLNLLPSKIVVPILVIHGTDDQQSPIVDTREFVRRVPCKDKMLHEVKGGCHGLLQGPHNEDVYDLMFLFFKKQRFKIVQTKQEITFKRMLSWDHSPRKIQTFEVVKTTLVDDLDLLGTNKPEAGQKETVGASPDNLFYNPKRPPTSTVPLSGGQEPKNDSDDDLPSAEHIEDPAQRRPKRPSKIKTQKIELVAPGRVQLMNSPRSLEEV